MRQLYALTMIIFSVVTPARCMQATAVEQRWLSYEPAVLRLEGTLTIELKYGPPNYGEQPKTDARVRVPVLRLIEPVNVRGKPGESFNAISVKDIRRIQLVFSPGTSYEEFIGKRVVVEGTLFHAFSGHHYTKVLMDVRSINRRRDFRKVLHMHSVISEESAESLALFYAAGTGDQARVQSLIKAGFDLNGRDENGMTALFPAARNGKATPAIIALLVSAGCDVNVRDKAGETALLYAIDPGGSLENIKALLDAGADVDIPSVVGETPLMRASDWGSVNVLKMLLEKGAKPDLKGWRGKTALMIAAEDGEYESVVLLIEHNANPNFRDNRGNTALSLAIANFKTPGRVNRYTRRPFIQTISLLRRVTRSEVKTIRYAGETPQLSAVVWTDRAQYSLHEEMKINAALRNNGNAAGYVDRRLHWGGLAGGFKLEIRNEQGKALPTSLESDAPMPPPKEGDTSILIKLEPGFLYGSHVQLDVKDFFPKPGRYSLRVAYGSSLMKELVVPQFRDLPALWRDSPIIISEPVWIEVISTAHRVRR